MLGSYSGGWSSPHAGRPEDLRQAARRKTKATENSESQPSIIRVPLRKSTGLWISDMHRCSPVDSEKRWKVRYEDNFTTSTTQSRDDELTESVRTNFCWVLINSATSKGPWNLGRNTTKKLHKRNISLIRLNQRFAKYRSTFSYFKGSSNFWNKIKSTLIF